MIVVVNRQFIYDFVSQLLKVETNCRPVLYHSHDECINNILSLISYVPDLAYCLPCLLNCFPSLVGKTPKLGTTITDIFSEGEGLLGRESPEG